MNRYVLGFMFEDDCVLLIKKKRPAWQYGLLNGVGGKMEPGEAPKDAMQREFLEETGLDVTESGAEWKYCVMLQGDDSKYVDSGEPFVVHVAISPRMKTLGLSP